MKEETCRISQTESQNQLVFSFSKNTLEEVRVNLVTFPKRPKAKYFDLRIWGTEGVNSPGLGKPTHKGICLDVEFLPQLLGAVEAAIAAVEKDDASA